MSPTKKPSAVDGLRRGMGTAPRDLTVRSDDSIGAKRTSSTHPDAIPYLEAVRRNAPPPRPPKDVRFTLDLTEDRHAFLKRFAEESGAGVRASQVMRALLDELAEGPNLAARVRARIWAAKK